MIAGVRHVVAAGLCGNAFGGAAKSGRAVVAFEAKREGGRTLEEAWIGATVWDVAGLAAVDPGGGVLKDERSAFIGMALQTGLFVDRLIDHPRPSGCSPGRSAGAVWIVAIAAGHEAFVHAMFEGH